MTFPHAPERITSPADLVRVLQLVKKALASGAMRQVELADAVLPAIDLATVSPTGPWPDFIDAMVEEVGTGARYRLTVETFHGAGGSWARAED